MLKEEKLEQREAGCFPCQGCAASAPQPPGWSHFPDLHKGAVWPVGASAEQERGSLGFLEDSC